MLNSIDLEDRDPVYTVGVPVAVVLVGLLGTWYTPMAPARRMIAVSTFQIGVLGATKATKIAAAFATVATHAFALVILIKAMETIPPPVAIRVA